MEHLELTRFMFVTGLIRTKRTSYTQFSLKKELHNKLKSTVQMKRMRKMGKKEETYTKFKFSEVKQNLGYITFCGL
jgi:hypothetical protein